MSQQNQNSASRGQHRLVIGAASACLAVAIIDVWLQYQGYNLHLGIIALIATILACFVELYRAITEGSTNIDQLRSDLITKHDTASNILSTLTSTTTTLVQSSQLLRRSARLKKGHSFEDWLRFANIVVDDASNYLYSLRARHPATHTSLEERYFRTLKHKVLNDNLHHKRLVSLRAQLSYRHNRDLLSSLAAANRLEVRAWIGAHFPLTCALVLSERMVAIGFYKSNDDEPRSCWLIEDSDFARDMGDLFDSYWRADASYIVREEGTGVVMPQPSFRF
jgi:hypothetical protein